MREPGAKICLQKYKRVLQIREHTKTVFCSNMHFVEDTVTSWLVRSFPDRAVQFRAMPTDIVLCSWGRQFTLTVPLILRYMTEQSRSQSPRIFWSAPRHRVLALTKRHVGSGNEIDDSVQRQLKTDSAQSSSNKCKNYLLKIYSQHINFLNTIRNFSL